MKRAMLLVFTTLFIVMCNKPAQEPNISQYSDIYQVNGKWFCPICNKPVKNGDRSKIDPALQLSEWHDTFLDPEYFKSKIDHISDQELISSLVLPNGLQSEIKGKSADELDQILKKYFSQQLTNNRLYKYDGVEKIPFITRDEFLNDLKNDPERKTGLLKQAAHIADPDSGYRIGEIPFGFKVNFDYNWQDRSDYGVHYCHFFRILLGAYLATGDNFYQTSFEDLFNQWYEQIDQVKHEQKPWETKLRDVIWYELGLGVRIPYFIDSYKTYKDSLTPETHKRMLKNILGSARWLYECLSTTPFHPYNWQTQTSMTLAYIALTFPEFTESDKWLEASKKNMIQHFENDINDDGGYIERTGSYTSYVFGMFYRYMLMFKYLENDTTLLETYLPRLENLMEFTAYTTTPMGLNCPFNDCGRGTYLTDLLIEMGDFFNRGEFLGAVQNSVPSKKLANSKVKPVIPSKLSVDFPYSKFAVMRDGWNYNSYFMMINYGPFENHGHYDILDFEMYANGQALAVDAGLGLKGYSEPIHVSWYKRAPAHNMLTINNISPNKRNISGENVIKAFQTNTDYFAATHRGYEQYQQTTVRRHFVFVKGEYWLIVDDVCTSQTNKNLEWNLHTPLDMEITDQGFISKQENGVLLIHPAAEQTEKILKSGYADLRGLPNEKTNRKIDWVVFQKKSKADSTLDNFNILAFPFTKETKQHAETVSFSTVETGNKNIAVYEIKTDQYTDVIILSDGNMHNFIKNIEGDFSYGWFRFKEDQLSDISIANAGTVKISDAIHLKFGKKTNLEQSF